MKLLSKPKIAVLGLLMLGSARANWIDPTGVFQTSSVGYYSINKVWVHTTNPSQSPTDSHILYVTLATGTAGVQGATFRFYVSNANTTGLQRLNSFLSMLLTAKSTGTRISIDVYGGNGAVLAQEYDFDALIVE